LLSQSKQPDEGDLIMKTLLALLTLSISASSYAHLGKMTCFFTEPFIAYDIYENGKVIYSEAIMEDKKDLSKKVKFTGPTLNSKGLLSYKLQGIEAFDEKKLVMDIELNVTGTDHMSDQIYPFTAVIKNYYGDGSDLSGACVTEKLTAAYQDGVSYPGENADHDAFFALIQTDIKSCFLRALSDWTKKKSDYLNQSVFSVLYGTYHAYEATQVIDTLASGESDELGALVDKTKFVPSTKKEKALFERNAVKACEYYASRLLSRVK
jgi:hypothetical protein